MAPTSVGAANPALRSQPPDTISDRSFHCSASGRKRSSRGRRWREIVMAAALSPATRASKRLIHAAFSYPIMGRLRADPGEKHETRVAISSPAEIPAFCVRRLPIRHDRRTRGGGERTAPVDSSRDREAAIRLVSEPFEAVEKGEPGARRSRLTNSVEGLASRVCGGLS